METIFGGAHPAWQITIGDFQEEVLKKEEPGSVDRVVLDMLAPWECVDAVATVLAPGGVWVNYVATVTQLSRTAEAIRADGRFTEPEAWESMVRGWHLDGLAVRPDHRMVAHTGFLITCRRLADGAIGIPGQKRVKNTEFAQEDLDAWTQGHDEEAWTPPAWASAGSPTASCAAPPRTPPPPPSAGPSSPPPTSPPRGAGGGRRGTGAAARPGSRGGLGRTGLSHGTAAFPLLQRWHARGRSRRPLTRMRMKTVRSGGERRRDRDMPTEHGAGTFRKEPPGRTNANAQLESRLGAAERQVAVLRDKARNLDRQLATAAQNNSRLVAILERTREEIIALKARPGEGRGNPVQLRHRRCS